VEIPHKPRRFTKRYQGDFTQPCIFGTEFTCTGVEFTPALLGPSESGWYRIHPTLFHSPQAQASASSMFWPSAVRRVIWLDCQEFVTSMYLSLIQLAMTYRQAHGRAASLIPKNRPKVHLPAHSAPRLQRDPPPAARTVAQHAKRTGSLMTDASHRVSKPTPQSVAQSRPPFPQAV